MVKEILRKLATDINDNASADAMVSYIYDTGGHQLKDSAWVDDFADAQALDTVFEGSIYSDGQVTLSAKANLLKNALLRRNRN